jgi:hypothetical protein
LSESFQAIISVSNTTPWDMQLQGQHLDWGKWDGSPPQTISAGGSANFKAEGKDFTPTGTQGSVTYTLLSTPQNATVTMTFDVPLVGADSVAISCDPPGVANVSVLQSRGDKDQITYNVNPSTPPPATPIKNHYCPKQAQI